LAIYGSFWSDRNRISFARDLLTTQAMKFQKLLLREQLLSEYEELTSQFLNYEHLKERIRLTSSNLMDKEDQRKAMGIDF
jgi:hypothetical protein